MKIKQLSHVELIHKAFVHGDEDGAVAQSIRELKKIAVLERGLDLCERSHRSSPKRGS